MLYGIILEICNSKASREITGCTTYGLRLAPFSVPTLYMVVPESTLRFVVLRGISTALSAPHRAKCGEAQPS